MMLCSSCGTQNVEGARFCAKCGATLAAVSGTAPAPGSWQTPTGDLQNPGNAGYSNTGNYGAGATPSITSPVYANSSMRSMSGHLNYAQWLDRVIGAIIDGVVVLPVFLVLFIVLRIVLGFGNLGGAALGISAFLSVLPVMLLNKVYLVGTRGASIGQGIMKLKVVDAAGERVSMGQALGRQAVALGLGFIPCLGSIAQIVDGLWPIWDEQHQTLHDKVASSFVIKTG